MSDSAMTVMAISERNDDIAQMAVQTSTTEFVDQARTKGVLTMENYDAFVQEISATGNAYEIGIEIKRIDENPGKKLAQAANNKIGENIYYSIYTTQIEDLLENPGKVKLKEGDILTVTVKNTNQTIGQMFKNFFYSIGGTNTSQIETQHSGVVTSSGN